MSHKAQIRFIKSVKRKFPQYFDNVDVVDIGSLDINGNARHFFTRSMYTGVDIMAGKNVDVVKQGHEYLKNQVRVYDTVVSFEAAEHDRHWFKTILAMYCALKPGGLFIFTAAGDGREEHGTTDHHANASPATNDYYQNISNEMFESVLPPEFFTTYHLENIDTDIRFYGIKAGGLSRPSPVPFLRRIENAVDEYNRQIAIAKTSHFLPIADRIGSLRYAFKNNFQ